MRKFKKIRDISPVEMLVTSYVHRSKKTVLMEGKKGVWCGWEGADGRLYPGAVVKPDKAHQAKIDEAKKINVEVRAKHRQKKITLDDIRARREAGEDVTQEDLNALADLLVGIL